MVELLTLGVVAFADAVLQVVSSLASQRRTWLELAFPSAPRSSRPPIVSCLGMHSALTPKSPTMHAATPNTKLMPEGHTLLAGRDEIAHAVRGAAVAGPSILPMPSMKATAPPRVPLTCGWRAHRMLVCETTAVAETSMHQQRASWRGCPPR